jgi:hypothetical protein
VNTQHPRLSTLLAAGLLAVLGTHACGGDGSEAPGAAAGVDDKPPATTTEPSTSTATSTVSTIDEDTVTSLRDTFEDDVNGWAMPPGPNGSLTVTGGDFVWESTEPVMLRPHIVATTLGQAYDAGRLDMTDVRVTAGVTPMRGAAAFGVTCREVPDSDSDFQWYEFVVRDGYAAIRLADSAGHLELLEEGRSEVPLGEQVDVSATCVDQPDGTAELTLSVDGEQLLQVQVPDPLGNGVPGLQAYDASAEESADRMLLAWHDFAVEPAG